MGWRTSQSEYCHRAMTAWFIPDPENYSSSFRPLTFLMFLTYWLPLQQALYPNPGSRQNILVVASLCNGKPGEWWRHVLYLRYVLAKWSVLAHWFSMSVTVSDTNGALLVTARLMIFCILASPSGFSKMISWIQSKRFYNPIHST